ncbi:MAG: hypothetical protein ACR2RV_01415 [Verrucomicrobiales bacterium]
MSAIEYLYAMPNLILRLLVVVVAILFLFQKFKVSVLLIGIGNFLLLASAVLTLLYRLQVAQDGYRVGFGLAQTSFIIGLLGNIVSTAGMIWLVVSYLKCLRRDSRQDPLVAGGSHSSNPYSYRPEP